MKPIAAACLLLLGATAPAIAGPAADAVAYLYENIDTPFEPEQRDRFTGSARTVLDANDAAWEKNQEACIDFSIVIDGQDWDAEEVARTLRLDEAVDGNDAVVTARFSNFGGQRTLEWTLLREDGVWRVADVASAEGEWRLSELTCE